MIRFSDVTQNTEAWFDLRAGKVTASNFGLFMANLGKPFGEPAKRYAIRIALERVTGIRSENNFSNSHTARGHQQESIARWLYEAENFCTTTPGGFFYTNEYGGSPDALVGCDGILEIKSVIASTHYATLVRKSYDPQYEWQLVGHLDCTGRKWIDFVSYCSEFPAATQLLTFRLFRNDHEAELRQLKERRDDFLSFVSRIEQKIKEAK